MNERDAEKIVRMINLSAGEKGNTSISWEAFAQAMVPSQPVHSPLLG
jgi:hypothetical protein